AKEMRLNPVADRLKEEFSQTNAKVYPIVKKYGKKLVVLSFIEDLLADNILMGVAYLGYLIYQAVVLGTMKLSVLVALYNASLGLKHALHYLGLSFPKFQEHALYAEKIRAFLEFEAEITDGELKCKAEDFRELSLDNVSFAYDGGEEVLRDISMTIRAGEKIAIVGYNGAGKTTLTKLLMRLYDVSAGSVTVNGNDIREYTVDSYRGLYATVFQDYKLFATTIAENVKMDKVEAQDRTEIIKALTESGFDGKLSELKSGIDTKLTREFDDEGVNLSGGEAQKVAIARTFYHSCPVIILDEPSSALDPISEYQLNQTMLHAAEDKTVIFISHRLSSTVMADRIYMLEKGRIIETGTHQELMEQNGKYAQMFAMQAEKYVS
ncbi:MAG: ABC transporter ATP-binding protein, partial [Lachnospiraceae bacterium]|nr:ABC transporter ATP-binding protein [Lachnospiraceae bacterium]